MAIIHQFRSARIMLQVNKISIAEIRSEWKGRRAETGSVLRSTRADGRVRSDDFSGTIIGRESHVPRNSG
jgi:hypothetical protein